MKNFAYGLFFMLLFFVFFNRPSWTDGEGLKERQEESD